MTNLPEDQSQCEELQRELDKKDQFLREAIELSKSNQGGIGTWARRLLLEFPKLAPDFDPKDTLWITYLKASGNYEHYDGMCDCSLCRNVREGYVAWKEGQSLQIK